MWRATLSHTVHFEFRQAELRALLIRLCDEDLPPALHDNPRADWGGPTAAARATAVFPLASHDALCLVLQELAQEETVPSISLYHTPYKVVPVPHATRRFFAELSSTRPTVDDTKTAVPATLRAVLLQSTQTRVRLLSLPLF